MNREAIFYKKTMTLYVFDSKNTASFVNCTTLAEAKQKIEKSGIEQKLKVA